MAASEHDIVRVLVVDDDAVDREQVRRLLPKAGINAVVVEEADPSAALAYLRGASVHLIILDYMFPQHDGLAVLREMRALDDVTPVIVMTGHDDVTLAVELMKAGAVDYLAKSALTAPRLARSIAHALRLRSSELARRAAENALRASEEFSRRVIESSHDSIKVLDLEGRLLAINPGGQRMLGLSDEATRERRSWLDLWPGEHRRAAAQAIAEACDGRTGRFVGFRALRSNQPNWWDVVITPVLGPDGRPERLVAMSRDVTEQKQQSDFEQQLLGIVSHDLRNPISAMVMAAMLLKERLLADPTSANVAQRIINSGERATRLIRDLLDFTQARLGRGIPVDPRSTNLHQVCKQALDEAVLSHPGRTVLHEVIGEGGGIWDPDRLAQAIGNLIHNAISYSPPDSPVTVRSHGRGPSVLLEVHNDGEPIDPEILPTLFQPFKRSARKLDPERSVGLGLFIVREIVAAHKGSLSVASTHGAGTTFRFELPRS